MITGFNTDIKHNEKVYHVQTEDKGVGNPYIESLVYVGGEILARELAHLKAAYLAQHDLPRAAASIDRLLILDDRDAYEVRDRAALAMQMHAYAQAIELFERYLLLMPSADDRTRVREQIAYLRAWLDQN